MYTLYLGSCRWSRYGQIRILRLYQAPVQIQWIRIVQVGVEGRRSKVKTGSSICMEPDRLRRQNRPCSPQTAGACRPRCLHVPSTRNNKTVEIDRIVLEAHYRPHYTQTSSVPVGTYSRPLSACESHGAKTRADRMKISISTTYHCPHYWTGFY